MKRLYVLAALLMVTTSAHAGNGISLEINGHKIHIEAPKNCDSLACIKVSAPDLSGSGFGFKGFKFANRDDDNDIAPPSDPPAQKSVSAPVDQTAAPPPSVAPASNTPSASPAIASTSTTPATDATAPALAAMPKPPIVAAAPVQAPTTPLGVWNTEENRGMVRIEQCGQNLCGYTVKANQKVLINMKPSESKWIGEIRDPDSGKTYDADIAMKGPSSLRVQGCAFGGMFCGGQTWTRVS